MSKWKINSSDFICTDCGNIQTMQRVTAKQFPKYNIRAIWCVNCKRNVAHIELQKSELTLAEIKMNGPQNETEEKIQKLLKRAQDIRGTKK